jgi:hypothetical protein
MAQLIFRDQNYVSSAMHSVVYKVCIYTMSIHPVYLVSELEVIDNGDPLDVIIHSYLQVTV